MDRAKRHKPTIEEFRQMCNFPPEQWMMTWDFLAGRLHEPRNSVGLVGPQKGGLHWDSWLDSFLDGDIGETLWGKGSNRKWSYPQDRAEIRRFLREIMSALAVRERRFLAARGGARGALVISNDLQHQSRKSFEDGRIYQYYRDYPQSSTSVPITAATTTTTRHPTSLREAPPPLPPREGFTRIDNTLIPSSPEHSAEGERPCTSNTTEPHYTIGDPQGPGAALTTSYPVTPGRTRPPPPTIPQSLPHHSHPSHCPQSSPTSATSPSDLVFKTRLSGSSKTKFLHASDVPTLLHFHHALAAKWRLGPHQRIRGVALRVAGDVYDVDPTDERDWGAMMKIARGGDGMAEVFVDIS